MADILEMIFTVVLDGAIDAAGAKSVSLPARMAVTAVLVLFVLGTSLPLIFIGVKTNSIGLVLLGVVLLLAYAIIIVNKIKKHNI
ncbi:MAG: hypothetical protein J6K30_02435 [Oscillospiraceae bacterium]|nr:hypothetical protein [Oscillospiraceae bacterium]